MSLEDTPEEAALRREVAAWLAEHAAKFGPSVGRSAMHDTIEYTDACRAWQAELDDGGWGIPMWPEEYGGKNLSSELARVIVEEQQHYNVPLGALSVAINMVGPTLMAHGTGEQQARLIDPIRRGEHAWCQLFSEPDAGSDLASLRTTARLEGDEWVVNGQKVWTSGAASADWGMLLARTDADSWRHAGITYFLVDMTTPGIEVRPLVQINRHAHFNEVFLNDVRIPVANVCGEVGDGWSVARTTLSAERVMIGSMSVADQVDNLIAVAQKHAVNDEPMIRQDLARAYTHAAILGFIGDRVTAATRTGGKVGAEASVMKLCISHLVEELGDIAMKVAGTDGMLSGAEGLEYGPLQELFLGQWATRIGGGTEQIQRNLISERVLGLPRDPRPTPPASVAS